MKLLDDVDTAVMIDHHTHPLPQHKQVTMGYGVANQDLTNIHHAHQVAAWIGDKSKQIGEIAGDLAVRMFAGPAAAFLEQTAVSLLDSGPSYQEQLSSPNDYMADTRGILPGPGGYYVTEPDF